MDKEAARGRAERGGWGTTRKECRRARDRERSSLDMPGREEKPLEQMAGLFFFFRCKTLPDARRDKKRTVPASVVR